MIAPSALFAGTDRKVRLWRVSDAIVLRTLMGHTDVVFEAAFSPDGTTVASASNDKTIKFWRVSDRSLRQTYDQETFDGVISIAVSPDSRLFAYSRRDGTVVVARNPFAAPALFASER